LILPSHERILREVLKIKHELGRIVLMSSKGIWGENIGPRKTRKEAKNAKVWWEEVWEERRFLGG
jgi:hypothetical protein